jgi:DNA-binding PucR family transcriptional regulator
VNEVQALIDSLATRLARPVGVDDRRFRAIAYSSHDDEIDAVRKISILGRRAPDAVAVWLDQLGLQQAQTRVRVPANAELGMVARVCFPVRFHDRLLGYLWLLDVGEPLSAEDLDLCDRCAEELAQELYRLRQQTNDERRMEAAWIADAVSGRGLGGVSSVAIATDALYAVMVARVAPPADGVAPAGIDVRLTEAVDQLRRSVSPRHQLAEVGDLHAVVVVAASSATEVDRHAAGLLAVAEAELADVKGVRVVVGVGDPTSSVDGLAVAHAEARRAVRVGVSMPETGPLVRWADLGVMRLLAELVGERDPGKLVPPSIRRLMADPDGAALLLTLEAYLEHAGDVASAAADLFLHRSSLYNRLRRIEEVAEVDIRSGPDRLELHLGVRLWRMTLASVPPVHEN